jgi:hypothetical protein
VGEERDRRQAIAMIRLNMIVEGQTEETFVRDVLGEHLASFGVYAYPRQVETGRKRIASAGGGKRVFRGGMTSYQKARGDILRWIKQEAHSPDVYVTTMFDLYALPDDFPQFDEAMSKATPQLRVAALEDALRADIGFQRFLPYIQLHEFEALVLADPSKIAPQFEMEVSDRNVQALIELVQSIPPEDVDDGEQTAPSKRIDRVFGGYRDDKSSVGPLIVQAIGLPQIRCKCPHFDGWVKQLEALGSPAQPAQSG